MVTFISDLEEYNRYLAENKNITKIQAEIKYIKAMPKRSRESAKNIARLEELQQSSKPEPYLLFTAEEAKNFLIKSSMCDISGNTYSKLIESMTKSIGDFLTELRWIGLPLIYIYEEIIAQELIDIILGNNIVDAIKYIRMFRDSQIADYIFYGNSSDLTSRSTAIFTNAVEDAITSARVRKVRDIDHALGMLDRAIIYIPCSA